jgi:hypothetical protein
MAAPGRPRRAAAPDQTTLQVLPDEAIEEFALLVKRYEDSHGLRSIVRFAHEMQGNWYK